MSARLPVPPAPGPLEEYATQFDELFATLAQRHSFREYLQGLLLPRDRNKTLTALAGAEPIAQAQAAPDFASPFRKSSHLSGRRLNRSPVARPRPRRAAWRHPAATRRA